MNVVLSILNVLGWTLLVLFLLILVILLIVLFNPVRYELEGSFDEKQWVKAKVIWLLRLLRVRLVYEDDLIFIEIKVGFFSKNLTFELGEAKEEIEEDAEDEVKEAAEESAKEALGEETLEEEKEAKSIISKIKGIINRIKKLYPKIKRIITDKQNHAAVLHIKKELIYLVKMFLPKASKVDAVFSTGSPDTTGQAYGVLACLPVVYRDNWKLLPDFEAEEAYFHGYFRLRGRIYVAQIVGALLRIVFDKNCRRMFTMIMKFLKSIKRKPSQEDK